MTKHISIDDLSAHIDGTLPPARRDLVDAHLATCADCRAERASLAWADAFARSLPPAELPDGLSFAVPVPDAPVLQAIPAIRRPRLGWMLVGSLAAMLLVAVGLGRLLSGSSSEGAAQLSPGPAGESADVGTSSGSAAGAGSEDAGAAAPQPPSGTAKAGSAAGTVTAVIAAGESLDIDTASRVAGGLVKEGDQAETRTGPLATALAADRERRVAGGSAGTSPAPGKATGAAAGTTGAGTPSPSIDRGGYAPPDAPIPGLPGARTGRDVATRATATTPASGTGTAAAAVGTAVTPAGTAVTPAGTAVTPGSGTAVTIKNGTAMAAQAATRQRSTAESVGGGAPVPVGTQTAWAATDTAASGQPARAGTTTVPEDRATAAIATAATRQEPGPTGSPSTPGPTAAAGTMASAASPGAVPLARTLLVPMTALSIGLLALGIILLRQARARRRRRGWREG